MGLIDFFFPKRCCGCGSIGSYFCGSCLKEIKQGELICPNCERPAIGGATHPLCQKKYGLDGLWSLGIYQESLKKAVQKLKYRFVFEMAESLIDFLIEYWARFSPYLLDEIKKDQGRGWIVVPVPLHPQRQRWRGFNQSALLGKILAQKLGLDYQEVLKRIKPTKPQVGLASKDRRDNMKNAFSLTKPVCPKVNFLLIDDVWTTGSTLKECCYVLKRAGAKKVWALTLAR